MAVWLPRPAWQGTDSRIRALMWAGAWHPPTLPWLPAGRAFGAYGYVTGGDPLLPSKRGSLFQTSSRNTGTLSSTLTEP